jgi:hypothetical protein
MFLDRSQRILVGVLACVPALAMCGEDDTGSGSGGTTGKQTGGAGGSAAADASTTTGGSGGTTAGTSSAGDGGTGETGQSGSPGTGASGGSLASGGSGGTSGSGGTNGDAGPPPTEAGLSVYSVQCSGDSAVCGYPAGQCLGVRLDDAKIGYACSNHCQSKADCSTAPTGAEAQPGCIPFSQQSRCVLICEDSGVHFACPSGMTCYTYPGAFIGYCLWM